MYTEKDLEQVIAEENSLRFDSFCNDDAIALFQLAFETAKELGVHICCQIMIGQFVAVRGFGNETDEGNIPFLNRKCNSVYKSGKSSMRCLVESELTGTSEDWQEDGETYVIKGGAFPIAKMDGTVLGVICISGLFHVDDHRFAVDVLRKFLRQ